MRHIDAEAVGAVIGPEAQGLLELFVDVRIVPIDVRRLLGEDMQVPLTVGHLFPRRAAEQGNPVVRRQLAMLAAAVSEDVAVAFGRTGSCSQRLLEEDVLIGGIVRHDIDDDFDASFVCGCNHGVEVVHGSQTRIDIAIVDDVVAAVRQVGGVERAQPDGVHAERLEIGDFLGDACDVAKSITVGVFEATRIDLKTTACFHQSSRLLFAVMGSAPGSK